MEVKWICSPDGCPDAYEIRQEVFIDEQKFTEEFDEIDHTCWHLVLYEAERAIACARIFFDEEAGCWHAGRIAVRKSERGRHLGKAVMDAIHEKVVSLGGDRVVLSAQCRARVFYEKQGYQAFGEEYFDEYCPHIMMEYRLNKK